MISGVTATLMFSAVLLVPTAGGSVVAEGSAKERQVVVGDRVVSVDPVGPGATPGRVPVNASPALTDVAGDVAEVFTEGCTSEGVAVCAGGDLESDVVVVLAGDSHAGQWWPAANDAATAHGWKLYLVGKQGCPLVETPIGLGDANETWTACSDWQRDAVSTVLGLDPDLIIYANHTQRYLTRNGADAAFPSKWREGAVRTLGHFTDRAAVLVVRSEERRVGKECPV